jgi:outer membrane protein OmpA-like peptidoglycan-associated protein
MSNSILSSVMNMLDADGVRNLAGRLGAPEQAVSSGIASSVGSMIGGLAKNSADSSFMQRIFDFVSGAPSDVNVSSLTNAALGSGGAAGGMAPVMDAGRRFLSMIFGDRRNSVNEAVGRASGLGSGVVRQIMALAAPLLLSVLGRRVQERGLTENSLRSDLLGEAAGIRHLLPPGFDNLFAETPGTASADAHRTAGGPSRWIWAWAAIALVLLGTLWAINRNRDQRQRGAQVGSAARSTAEGMKEGVTGLGNFVRRRLPCNTELRIPADGVEERLLAFIQSSGSAGDEVWFDFDRLVFDPDSATLRPESREQLQNIAAILKAYPGVRVKIGGYTDSTGDAGANLRLSQARASSVASELNRLGVSSDRLQAEGYGAQHPVADNSTEEGRAKNRRTAIRVTDKPDVSLGD